jgi:hypothetical protein
MGELWSKETCPACGAYNWYRIREYDGDDSKMDITDYRCWKCGIDVKMFVGDFGEQYRPHVADDDEPTWGDHVDGLENPI